MKKTFITVLITTVALAIYSQGLLNNGAHIVVSSETVLNIAGSSGHIQNESGTIDLSGKLKLGGNLINNFSNSNMFGTLANGSEVVFAGTGIQTIGGSSNAVITFDKLTVNSGSTTDVQATKQLTCNGNFVNNGTFTLKTNAENATATLLDNGVSGAGTNKVELYLSAGRNWYVSSPVSGATSAVFNTNASYPMYAYNESNTNTTPWTWITDDQTNLDVMTGYISSVQTSGIYTFTGGLINSGDKSFVLNRTAGQVKDGFNLVGNPYPSYVDLHAATRTNIIPTYWYRSKNDANTSYVFETYNLISELGISLSGKSMTNYIPPMQAFWVRVDAGCTSGNIDFTNSLRLHQDVSNNKFRAPATAGSLQSVLRLKITNGTNADEAIVFFNNRASDGYDVYDSPKMSNGNEAIPEIFTKVGAERLAINGLNEINDNSIPLGFTNYQSGINTFTISCSEASNFGMNVKLYLRDNFTGDIVPLTVGESYEFSSEKYNDSQRFDIINNTSISTGIDKLSDCNEVKVFVKNGNIINVKTIKQNSLIQTCKLIDIQGKELYNNEVNKPEFEINTNLPAGLYLVISKTNESTFINKVILK